MSKAYLSLLQIVRELAGYSYGRSDLVRRAMSKKKKDVMLEEKQYFIHGKLDNNGNIEIPGCVRNGISEEAAEAIFADMETFAQYAFNKSHAAAYAVVAYETGYLKKHYPVEFMAALMTSVIGNPGDVAKYIRNCQENGIEVLPPCINESQKKFSCVDGKIRFGLLGVKNVGENAIDAIIRARNEKGMPKDIFQFITNLEIREVNKKAIESLIKAGALDCLNTNRAAHLAVYESLMESAQNTAKKNIAGQMSLFQMNTEEMNTGTITSKLPLVENFSQDILLAMEKEMTGVYITDHPLNEYKEKIEKISNVNYDILATVTDENNTEPKVIDGMTATIAGMITGVKKLVTKSNQMMAFVDLEDLYGTVEIVVFPKTYERYKADIAEDKVVVIKGKLNFKEEEMPKILADSVINIDNVDDSKPEPPREYRRREERPVQNHNEAVKVRIPEDCNQQQVLNELQNVFRDNRGDAPVLIYLQDGKIVGTGEGMGVYPSLEFFDTVADIVGRPNIKGKPVF